MARRNRTRQQAETLSNFPQDNTAMSKEQEPAAPPKIEEAWHEPVTAAEGDVESANTPQPKGKPSKPVKTPHGGVLVNYN